MESSTASLLEQDSQREKKLVKSIDRTVETLTAVGYYVRLRGVCIPPLYIACERYVGALVCVQYKPFVCVRDPAHP